MISPPRSRHPRRDLELLGVACALLAFAAGLAADAPVASPQPVTFSTSDGGTISADLYGSGPRAVVLVPGGRFEKSSWEPQARRLAAAGFRVLAIELRGRGASRAGTAGPEAFQLDVLAAVRYLHETGAPSVSAVGASLGGWAVAQAVAEAGGGELESMVLLAHSPIEHPERIAGRKLFVLSRDDVRGGGVRRLPEIEDQVRRAPEPKELVVLDGSAHAQLLFDTDQGERLMAEILRFLSAERR